MEGERRRGKRRRTRKESGGGIPVYVHVIVIALILGVIAFSVFRLVRWNMGTVRTEGVVEGDFEVEVEDQVFLLPEDKKALHEDDGVETILFPGNDILTFYNNEEGFVEQVGQKSRQPEKDDKRQRKPEHHGNAADDGHHFWAEMVGEPFVKL